MFYKSELFFLQQILKRHHIPITILEPEKPIDPSLDIGIGKFFGIEQNNMCFYDYFPEIKPQTIYKVKDIFFCRYIFMLLPDSHPQKLLFIGPFSDSQITPQKILEKGESLGLEPRNIKQLELYLSSIIATIDENYIFTLLDTLSEFMWGDDNYTTVDINHDETSDFKPELKRDIPPDDTALKMHIMENRYAYENEIIEAVSHGRINKAEMMLSGFSALSFDRRLTDQLRNTKNYCIIMNTLLRKAAESGGVHPIYLDSLSSDYAKRIESLPSVLGAHEFMIEMFKDYCRLVKKQSMRHYSPPVQRAITCINMDLTADLSLSTLANANNVSASYFSTLFKNETGQTLTDFVNNARINHAKKLLKNTNLQVQTVAQHCGILDVHYFSKMFKKKVGKTPKEYRENAV